MKLLRKAINSPWTYLVVYGGLIVYYMVGLLSNLPDWPTWFGGLVFLISALFSVLLCMRRIREAEEAERAYKKARNECLSVRAEYQAMIGEIQEFQQKLN